MSTAAKASHESPNSINKQVRTCPHCGKTGKGPGMLRYHFDNCKHKGLTWSEPL
jgi:hypothetical protein